MKVYVVTSGCYSDTEIVGVYTTSELAKEAESLAGEDGCIIEFETDAVPKHEPDRKYFVVYMYENGELLGRVSSISAFGGGEDSSCMYDIGRNFGLGFTFHLWARDSEHAIKIANERRAMMIATTPVSP